MTKEILTKSISIRYPLGELEGMKLQVLDYCLVPLGLALMVAYHIWLVYRIRTQPLKTIIGVNAINRRIWVRAMMEEPSKNGVLAVQTLRNNIMASTVLASTAITLSSVLAMLMTSKLTPNITRQTSDTMPQIVVYGDDSQLGYSIKFFSILVCFLVAFLLNVQSIRYYSHASILINVPMNKSASSSSLLSSAHLTADYVSRSVNRGSYFWSLGLRAFYLSFPLFLWIFGPIPMFLCCVVLVSMLYFLDLTFEFGSTIIRDEEQGRL